MDSHKMQFNFFLNQRVTQCQNKIVTEAFLLQFFVVVVLTAQYKDTADSFPGRCTSASS